MKKNLVEAAIKAGVVEVYLGGWDLLRDLRKLNPELKSAEWLDFRGWTNNSPKTHYLPAPPDFQKESTYQDCITATYILETGLLELVMWDGDSMEGYPTDKRCKWVFLIDPTTTFFTKTIAPKIERRMEMRAEEIFEEREAKRVKNAIAAILRDLYK